MSNIGFEDKFITSILTGKLTLAELDHSNFSVSWLTFRREMYEWIYAYNQRNGGLPEKDLATTRYPDFEWQETNVNNSEIIQALNKNSVRRRLHTDIQKFAKLLQEGQEPEKIITQLRATAAKYEFDDGDQDVFDLTSPTFNVGKENFMQRVEAFKKNGIVGIPSGMGQEFDLFLNGGLYPGMLYGAVGVSGIGKSWMSQIFANGAMRNGKTPMYFAFEGDPVYEYFRFLSIASSISNSLTMQGALPVEAFNTAEAQVREFSAVNGTKYLLAVFGRRLEYPTELLHKKIVKHKPKLVIVDYLQMMKSAGSVESRWQMLLEVSRDLKIIAGAEQVPIIANMQTDTTGNSATTLEIGSIGDSKGVYRDFDFMWGYTKVKGRNHLVRVNSMKTRYGEGGDFKALYRTNWDSGKVEFLEHVSEDSVEDF